MIQLEPGAFVEDNDAKVLGMLAEAGLSSIPVPQPPFNRSVATFKFRHYYCMAILEVGHKKDEDNGLMMFMLSSVHFTEEQANDWFTCLRVCTTPTNEPHHIY